MTDPGTEGLEAALARAFAADTPPPEVVEAARAVFTWRTIDGELAELAFDSLLDAGAGVRAVAGPRALTFEAGDVAFELEVQERPEGLFLVGLVASPDVAPEQLELVGPPGKAGVTVTLDDRGRFRVPVAAGVPVRLHCRLGDRVVATEWLVP